MRRLKARGSLLPPGLEALASEQRAEEKAEELLRAAVEGAPRVHVAAAAPSMKKLERSRSQQLRLSLEEPAAQQLLQHAFVGGGGSEEGGVVSIGTAAHSGHHSEKHNHQLENRANTRGGQSAGTRAREEGDAESYVGAPECRGR